MPKEINTKLAAVVIVVLVAIVGFFAWRKMGSNSASSPAISADQAGLGKPVSPSIPADNARTSASGK